LAQTLGMVKEFDYGSSKTCTLESNLGKD